MVFEQEGVISFRFLHFVFNENQYPLHGNRTNPTAQYGTIQVQPIWVYLVTRAVYDQPPLNNCEQLTQLSTRRSLS